MSVRRGKIRFAFKRLHIFVKQRKIKEERPTYNHFFLGNNYRNQIQPYYLILHCSQNDIFALINELK